MNFFRSVKMNAKVLDFSMDNENKNLALEGAILQIENGFTELLYFK